MVDAQYPAPISISRDGSNALVRRNTIHGDAIDVVDLVSGKVLFTHQLPYPHVALSWSPDGDKIAFFSRTEEAVESYRLSVWNLRTGTTSTIGDSLTRTIIQPPRWSPDGTALAYFVGNDSSGTLWLVPSTPSLAPKMLIESVRTPSDWVWSEDGRSLALVQLATPNALTIMEVKSGATRLIPVDTSAAAEIRELAWSSSGRKLAFTIRSESDFFELRLLDLAKNRTERCLVGPGEVSSPHFMSDNSTIVFVASRQARSALFSTHCDSSTPRILGPWSGSNRFVKILSNAHAGSVAYLQADLTSPACLYELSMRTERRKPAFCAPRRAELQSPTSFLEMVKSSDGVEIPTIVRPASPTGKQSDVVLIDVHGGPHLEEDLSWNLLSAVVGRNGIEVVAPNYRGSSGFGADFERAGDLASRTEDVLAVCRYVRRTHGKSTRVVLFGTSYGAAVAVTASVSEPNCADALVLVSLLPHAMTGIAPARTSIRILAFHGVHDINSGKEAQTQLERIFGPGVFDTSSNEFRAFASEGHVFRNSETWKEIYSRLRTVAGEVSSKPARGTGDNAK